MDEIEAAYRRERTFILDCTDARRLMERMAAYRSDLEQARRHQWSGNIEYAESLLDLGAGRMAELAEAARAAERAAVEAHAAAQVRAATYAPPRSLPPPLRSPPRNVPWADAPRHAAPPPPRYTPPPHRYTPPPPRYTPPPLAVQSARGPIETAPWAPAAPSTPASAPARIDAGVRTPPRADASGASPAPPARAPDDPEVATRNRVLTGRDLAAFRVAKGLSYREAAARLGSLHGTLAKAEARPDRPLADRLQAALRVALGG